MAKHIYKRAGAPNFAPPQIGHHYVNITNGDQYLSKGTSDPSDWVLLGSGVDERVKITSSDTTNGYLNTKLTVDNGTNTANPLEKSIVTPGSNEKLNIRFDQTKISVSSSQIPDFIEAVQDAVGNILVDSASIDFNYNDAANTITATVISSGIIGTGLKIKSGTVASSSFTGSPKKVTVTFASPFSDVNYTITITGTDNRTWSWESKTVNGFIINSNANTALTGNVDWQAIKIGESN